MWQNNGSIMVAFIAFYVFSSLISNFKVFYLLEHIYIYTHLHIYPYLYIHMNLCHWTI
jgi:hypothetical protein